jgi:mannose-1-phosphate guanylyltransferase
MKINSDIKNRFVIIMAGGRGERFWPLSREKMPKQLLTLLGKRSFLQQAVDRVLPLVPAKNIFIITNEAQLPEVRKQLPTSENPQSQPRRVVVGCRRRQRGGESNCQPRQVL